MSSPATTSYHPAFDSMINSVDTSIDDFTPHTEGDLSQLLHGNSEALSYFQLVDINARVVELIEERLSKIINADYCSDNLKPTVTRNFILRRREGASQSNNRSFIQNLDIYGQAIRKLNSLRSLEEGWDGYNAVPPDSLAIQDAIRFIRANLDDFSPVVVSASADGDIELYWDHGGIFLNLCFDGSGRFSAYGERSSVLTREVEEELLLDDIPVSARDEDERLREVLRWIFKD